MMKNRRLLISLGLIAVLLLYIVFSRTNRSADIPEVESFESADDIMVKREKGPLHLYLKDGIWVINDEAYPADKTKVENMEKEMRDFKITDFISKSPFYEKYNLTEDKAVRVTVKKEGAVKRDILLGKKSSTNRNTYVKFPDKNEIYLASGDIVSVFDKEVNDLRDMGICEISPDSLASIELNYKGSRLKFVKETTEVKDAQAEKDNKVKEADKDKQPQKAEKWVCEQYRNAALDKNQVDAFVKAFASVKADSYSDMKKQDMKGVICSVKSRVQDKDIEHKIYKEDSDGKYFCTSTESPYVFMLADWKAKKFLKTIADFKEKKPVNKPPMIPEKKSVNKSPVIPGKKAAEVKVK